MRDEFLDKEYLEEQLMKWGELEEYEDGIAICPYCGYRNEVIEEDNFDDYEGEECECWACGKIFLIDLDISVKFYYKSRKSTA